MTLLPETDCLYIELKAGPGGETREVAPGECGLRYGWHDRGVDIEGASRLDFGTLGAPGVPMMTLKATK